ncbi:hypothetical protein VP01_2275g2 [Puccinia sorghi]|uniref:Uncharacterized protein n=1 Tax=Puccinia sorghi TaxID=27349 RepID=A0A0L6V890_9BASI|nr:hypothetical protein VP01_2275g2 [Puccinia sorghi]
MNRIIYPLNWMSNLPKVFAAESVFISTILSQLTFELFIKKKIYRGHKDFGNLDYYSKLPTILPNVIAKPCCVFISQPILTWITWLLSMPHTKSEIEDWIQNTAWKSRPHILKLSVSLFVDWFNPRGNKISSKVESACLLAFSCLNLPPTIRNKLSPLCIARITPGPYSADPQTFNHLLSPLVKLLAVLGDIPATKKVAGYASHSATKFCAFYHAKQTKIPLLQLSRRRKKEEKILSAQNSKDATAQEVILKDSVVMHNWLEGILQGHLCFRWRFGDLPPQRGQRKRRHRPISNSVSNKPGRIVVESFMDIDPKDLTDLSEDDEDDDLLLNAGFGGSIFYQKRPSHGKLSASQWHALFVFIIPIVLCELFDKESHAQTWYLRGNSNKPTSIDLKCTTKNTRALLATYMKALWSNPTINFPLIFPNKCQIGVLLSVTEFPGERLIGFLQKINTNNKIDEMHQTMMTRGSLEKDKTQRPKRENKIWLVESRYNLLFNLLAGRDWMVVHQDKFRSQSVIGFCGKKSPHPRNCIVANSKEGKQEECLVMSEITNLYPKVTTAIPTRPFRYLLFLFGMVFGRVETIEEVILPSQVVSLAAYRLLEKNTFSIPENGICLIPRAYDAFLNISGNQPDS